LAPLGHVQPVGNRRLEVSKPKLRENASQVIDRLSPKPTPLQERYLVLRLLEELDARRIPETQSALNSATAKSYANPKVRDKFPADLELSRFAAPDFEVTP